MSKIIYMNMDIDTNVHLRHYDKALSIQCY